MFKKLAPIEALSINKASPQNRLQLTHIKDSPTLDNETKSSRITSLTSMWSDNTYSEKNEKVGIRRLARACTKSLSQWNSGILNSEDEGNDLSTRYSRNSYLSNRSLLEADYKKLSHVEKKHENEIELRKLRKLHFDRPTSTGESTRNQQRKALGISKPSLENIANNSVREPKLDVTKTTRKPLDLFQPKRVVVIKDMIKTCGAKSIISQICGGPLERIVFHEHKQGLIMELYFIFPEHAKNFYNFGSNTGLLILNGERLAIEWANRTNTNEVEHCHPFVPKYLMHEINYYGARRCLIFSKTVPDKLTRRSHTMHYPSPKTHLSKDLDIEEIRKDFAAFGEIIDIASVISRKLCFCLHFADIRSAILAKKECELEGSLFNSKYNNWSIWYGKDPTDKPCLSV